MIQNQYIRWNLTCTLILLQIRQTAGPASSWSPESEIAGKGWHIAEWEAIHVLWDTEKSSLQPDTHTSAVHQTTQGTSKFPIRVLHVHVFNPAKKDRKA